jgi:hypothetical protein
MYIVRMHFSSYLRCCRARFFFKHALSVRAGINGTSVQVMAVLCAINVSVAPSFSAVHAVPVRNKLPSVRPGGEISVGGIGLGWGEGGERGGDS